MKTNFEKFLLEGNMSNFTRVENIPDSTDSSIILEKMLYTIANIHETCADLYKSKGNSQKAAYHNQLAQRFLSEARTKS